MYNGTSIKQKHSIHLLKNSNKIPVGIFSGHAKWFYRSFGIINRWWQHKRLGPYTKNNNWYRLTLTDIIMSEVNIGVRLLAESESDCRQILSSKQDYRAWQNWQKQPFQSSRRLRSVNAWKTAELRIRRVEIGSVLIWDCFHLSYPPRLIMNILPGQEAMRTGTWGLSHFMAVGDTHAALSVEVRLLAGIEKAYYWLRLCPCVEETRKGPAENKSQGELKNGLNLKGVSPIYANPLVGDKSLTRCLSTISAQSLDDY